MTLLDSLRVLRRRWPVVVAAVVAGVVAGWVTAPGDSGPTSYRATHTLIVAPTAGSLNLEQAALLATTGVIPERVAERLDLAPRQVAARVSGVADTQLAVLTVTGRSTAPDLAEALADATAEELVAELTGADLEVYEEELARLADQVVAARERLAEAQAVPGAVDGTDPDAASELQVARSDVSSAIQDQQSHERQGPPPAPLQSVEAARAAEVRPDGLAAPTGKAQRAALLGGFGLLLGVGAAYGLDRLDLRIHTKRSAESAFGRPVVAQIPALGRAGDDELLAVTQPSTPFVEAYRALRSVVALNAMVVDGRDDASQRVLLVTSPMAGEGKTTTVANLAVALAEVGRSVLVVSADFRRPRLHAYFGSGREPGLSDALGAAGTRAVTDLEQPTAVEGVTLLASGPPVENPAVQLEQLGEVLHSARDRYDIVLVDGPPLLVANDATVLAQEVDGVLLLARAGRTTSDAAERSVEILDRVGAPIVGVVIVASEDTPSAYRYNRNRYYTEARPSRRRSRVFGGRRRRQPSGHDGSATSGASPPVSTDARR